MPQSAGSAMQFDLFSAQAAANPYPIYSALRDQDPVHWNGAAGAWLLSRYDDVLAALRDRRLSARWVDSFMAGLADGDRKRLGLLERHVSSWMLTSDPPEHTRRRRPVNASFTPTVVEVIQPRIQAIVDDLLGSVSGDDLDVVGDFAYPLPATVIAELLGVPAADRDRFRGWAEDILGFIAADRAVTDRAEAAQRSLSDQTEYLKDIFARRRTQPEDDLISRLLAAEGMTNELSDDERVAICVQLLLDGHETTTCLIGNATLALLRSPLQHQWLLDNPGSLDQAVEEFLRYDGPVQVAIRVAAEDMELAGRHIAKGQLVWLLLASANRDPERFPDPDRLDFTRDGSRHLAFGFGTHFCIGSLLAKVEARVALAALLRRFERFRLAVPEQDLAWIDVPMVHGVISLPITAAPAPAQRPG